MRNKFAEVLYENACKNDDIAIVVADISPAGSMVKFREEQPDRFLNVGVSEQSMIGICAGLALKGLRPFAYTIATFSLYRPFEMVRDDLCYQNLPVTVVGIGAGVVYSTLGGTHQAMEDIAVAAAVPNMQVISPCDPLETEAATNFCAQESQGPTYLRLGKAGEPNLTKDAVDPFIFGKIRYLKKSDQAKTCILSHGIIMEMAFEVAKELAEEVDIISVHTLKPLDEDGLKKVLGAYDKVIVIEEHAPQGALASQLKQLAWDEQAKCKLHTFTLKDQFIHHYGNHRELLRLHGLATDLIVEQVKD